MLLELTIKLIVDVIGVFLSWIPVFAIPESVMIQMNSWYEMVNFISHFMPLKTLALCTTVFLAFHATKLVAAIVNWIIAKIPTIG